MPRGSDTELLRAYDCIHVWVSTRNIVNTARFWVEWTRVPVPSSISGHAVQAMSSEVCFFRRY